MTALSPNRRDLPHAVVVGAGFGGLSAARALADRPVRVTIVDRRNHHLFQPLLYQVATGGLSGPDIATPIRRVFQDSLNITVLMGNVETIAPLHRTIVVDGQPLAFDYLVVAAGAHTDYFGHADWKDDAPGLKSIDDALDIRRRLYLAYEAAEWETDPTRQRRWLTFVVVGGGPTGVELAGAIAEIARHTLARDFRNVDPTQTRVVLVEGGRLLAGMDEISGERAKKALEARGVEVMLGSMVDRVDEDGIETGGRFIHANTVLWAAGVEPSPLGKSLSAPLHRGRVLVAPDLSVPGAPHVFVIGDMMGLRQDGKWLPGVAQVAIQGGRHAAANILAHIEGRPTTEFRYRDKGTMATIGRSAAVAEIAGTHTAGIVAWLIWWAVHLFFLIGFRNRVAVMLEWMWAYVTWQRSARIIIPHPDHRWTKLRSWSDRPALEAPDRAKMEPALPAPAANRVAE